MNLIFSSHKGRIIRKIFFVALAAAFVSMVWSANSEPVEDTTTNSAAVVDQQPQVDSARVYVDPNAEGEGASASPSPSATPTEGSQQDNQQAIINSAASPASALVTAWTSYDYKEPPAANSISGYPQDPANATTIKPKYDAWVKNMQDKQELSTGQVTNVQLVSIDYVGSLANGYGKAVFVISVNTTVANSEVGAAGSSVVNKYTVTVNRLQNTTTEDDNEWFVSDITNA